MDRLTSHKISHFDDVQLGRNRVGVIPPLRSEWEKKGNIHIPEQDKEGGAPVDMPWILAKKGFGEDGTPLDLGGIEVGDHVLISLYQQQPHQYIERPFKPEGENNESDENLILMVIDTGMVVARVNPDLNTRKVDSAISGVRQN